MVASLTFQFCQVPKHSPNITANNTPAIFLPMSQNGLFDYQVTGLATSPNKAKPWIAISCFCTLFRFSEIVRCWSLRSSVSKPNLSTAQFLRLGLDQQVYKHISFSSTHHKDLRQVLKAKQCNILQAGHPMCFSTYLTVLGTFREVFGRCGGMLLGHVWNMFARFF